MPGVEASTVSCRPLRPLTTPLGSENVASTMLSGWPSGSLTCRSTLADVPTVTEIDWFVAIGGRFAGGPFTITVAGAETPPSTSRTR